MARIDPLDEADVVRAASTALRSCEVGSTLTVTATLTFACEEGSSFTMPAASAAALLSRRSRGAAGSSPARSTVSDLTSSA